MDVGPKQNGRHSWEFKPRCWFCRTLVYPAVMVLMLTHFAAAQRPFDVSNPKQLKWPQAEAERIYFSTGRDLAAEFKLTQLPRARFTLVLGADQNSVDMNTRELRLKKWDKYLYAEGVLRLSFDQILSSDAKMRLARRAVAESEATVNWYDTSSTSLEPWYEDPSPAHGWASPQPR
jgi:hypothetical protein